MHTFRSSKFRICKIFLIRTKTPICWTNQPCQSPLRYCIRMIKSLSFSLLLFLLTLVLGHSEHDCCSAGYCCWISRGRTSSEGPGCSLQELGRVSGDTGDWLLVKTIVDFRAVRHWNLKYTLFFQSYSRSRRWINLKSSHETFCSCSKNRRRTCQAYCSRCEDGRNAGA